MFFVLPLLILAQAVPDLLSSLSLPSSLSLSHIHTKKFAPLKTHFSAYKRALQHAKSQSKTRGWLIGKKDTK
ncbi:hypothetical protein F4809DRAFT_622203 [Biscogniauxia mediterranea]|nr:hypothetical protein F4809DRAFT_622203 [Biscogniauxia mediterranea]